MDYRHENQDCYTSGQESKGGRYGVFVDESPLWIARFAIKAENVISKTSRWSLDPIVAVLLTRRDLSVLDKNLGPLVKTIMTRCIQCTRLVTPTKIEGYTLPQSSSLPGYLHQLSRIWT